jgi:hypothetical protein
MLVSGIITGGISVDTTFLQYTPEDVLRLVIADASIRTGIPATALTGEFGKGGVRIRSAFTDQSHSILPLRISPQCKAKYAGRWLHPANVTPSVVHEILRRLPTHAAEEAYCLFVVHDNRPACALSASAVRDCHDALHNAVMGVHYRIASGYDTAGKHRSQLWVVSPGYSNFADTTEAA